MFLLLSLLTIFQIVFSRYLDPQKSSLQDQNVNIQNAKPVYIFKQFIYPKIEEDGDSTHQDVKCFSVTFERTQEILFSNLPFLDITIWLFSI